MCQHRSISCNNVYPYGEDNYARGYAYVRADSIWEIFIPSVQSCFECETCLKNKMQHISKGGKTHCSALLSDDNDARIKAMREDSVTKLKVRKEISLEGKLTY